MKEIGKIIKERRNVLQINQQTLADLASVSINTVVSIERGVGNPSLKTLKVIMDVLGLELTCKVKNV